MYKRQLQIPFTLAHEMAHGYGITDEGDCNTLAYLVCLHSKNKAIQYSGLLAYLRYLWNDSRMDSVDKNSLRDLLSPEVKMCIRDSCSPWVCLSILKRKRSDLF